MTQETTFITLHALNELEKKYLELYKEAKNDRTIEECLNAIEMVSNARQELKQIFINKK